MTRDGEDSSEDKKDLTWKDYVAIIVAMLTTTLLPIVIISTAVIAIVIIISLL